MTRFLLLCLSLLGASVCLAQTMSFSPDDDFNGIAVLENYNVFQIDIFNETEDSLKLDWKFIENTTPEAWDITLCDNMACFGYVPDNGMMNPILDEPAFIKLDVNPGIVDGAGTLTFLIFKSDDQTVSHEIRFHISTILVDNEFIPQVEVQIFPNPASDFVMVENFEPKDLQITMTNSGGQSFHQSILKTGQINKIETSHLPNGYYLLNLISDRKKQSTKKILVSH